MSPVCFLDNRISELLSVLRRTYKHDPNSRRSTTAGKTEHDAVQVAHLNLSRTFAEGK
jgi:hypothetical protein